MIDQFAIGAVICIICFVIWIMPRKTKQPNRKGSQEVGYILPNGIVIYRNKPITLQEARNKKLQLVFSQDEKKKDEYRPKAWR